MAQLNWSLYSHEPRTEGAIEKVRETTHGFVHAIKLHTFTKIVSLLHSYDYNEGIGNHIKMHIISYHYLTFWHFWIPKLEARLLQPSCQNFLYANSRRSIYTLSMTKNQQPLVMRMGTSKTFFQSRLEVCCVCNSMCESQNQGSQLYSFFFDMWGLIDFTTSWMVILSWTKTFFSFSSHRISFLFSEFWKRRQHIKACFIN